MNIEWVIPCRFVEVHDNLATIVGGGIDTFWLTTEPRIVQVMFTIRVTALHDELDGDARFSMMSRVRAPGDDIVFDLSGEFGFEVHSDPAQPDFLAGIVLPAVVQFAAETEGTYTVTHRFGDSEHSLPLHVVHGFPPGMEPPPG